MKRKQWLATILAAGLTLSLLGGCGSSGSTMKEAVNGIAYQGAYDGVYEMEEATYPAEAAALTSQSGSGQSNQLPQSQKWVITGDMSVETENMDTLLSDIQSIVASLGGYTESQSVYNGSSYSTYRHRDASLTVRIPADRLDEFTKSVSEKGNVTNSSRSAKDVTLSYTDTENRIAVLKTEQTRLMELLAKAENMSDLLEIESRLTEVRYQLENYTSQLRKMDNQIDYATINMNVSEVTKYTPAQKQTFWQRITSGLKDNIEGLWEGIQDFLVWFITSLPTLAVLGVILWAVIAVCVRIARRRKAKRIAKAIQMQQAAEAAEAAKAAEET